VKGLKLAEEYFRIHGTKMIEEKFPGYENRIAAGLVGEGSECYFSASRRQGLFAIKVR